MDIARFLEGYFVRVRSGYIDLKIPASIVAKAS
jgi:hypothetical protein